MRKTGNKPYRIKENATEDDKMFLKFLNLFVSFNNLLNEGLNTFNVGKYFLHKIII